MTTGQLWRLEGPAELRAAALPASAELEGVGGELPDGHRPAGIPEWDTRGTPLPVTEAPGPHRWPYFTLQKVPFASTQSQDSLCIPTENTAETHTGGDSGPRTAWGTLTLGDSGDSRVAMSPQTLRLLQTQEPLPVAPSRPHCVPCDTGVGTGRTPAPGRITEVAP